MAKNEPKPLVIQNVTTGDLILPDGTVISPGQTVPLPAQYAENEGVLSWVADGLAQVGN